MNSIADLIHALTNPQDFHFELRGNEWVVTPRAAQTGAANAAQ